MNLQRSELGYELEAATVVSTIMELPDSHQHLEINLLNSGTLSYLCVGRLESISHGELAVFWAALPHQVVALQNIGTLSWIHIPLSWFLKWDVPQPFVQRIMGGEFVREKDAGRAQIDLYNVERWVHDIKHGTGPDIDASLAEIRARIFRLAADTASPESSAAAGHERGDVSDRVLGAAKYITEHYDEAIYIKDIARHAGLSPDYLMKQFRGRFGMSIIEFTNRHRVFHALRSMSTTDHSISTIAFDAGFGSVSQFNEIFKRICGKSPREYRRIFRAGRPEDLKTSGRRGG